MDHRQHEILAAVEEAEAQKVGPHERPPAVQQRRGKRSPPPVLVDHHGAGRGVHIDLGQHLVEIGDRLVHDGLPQASAPAGDIHPVMRVIFGKALRAVLEELCHLIRPPAGKAHEAPAEARSAWHHKRDLIAR